MYYSSSRSNYFHSRLSKSIIDYSQGFLPLQSDEFIVFDSGLLKEQGLLYVLLDIENAHYLTDPLSLTSKTKLIWMELVSFIFFFYFI